MAVIGRTHFLDLSRHHFKRDVGDLTIYGVWIPSADSDDDSEPALAIIPRYRRIKAPCVIALSAVYKYDDPRYLAHASHIFCESLGIEQNIGNAMKVANLINDHLSDLISMPPEPLEAVSVGTGRVIHANGSYRTANIFDHQPARL